MTKSCASETGPELFVSDAAGLEQRVVCGKTTSPEWWMQFQSPDLNHIVEEAIRANRTLAATKATLAQAYEAVNEVAGALYPQLDVAATAGRQKYGVAFLGKTPTPSAFSYFSVGPSVSYALDIFGGTKRHIEGQQALAEYQGYQLDAAFLTLTGNVVIQSLSIASMRAQIRAVGDILADDQTNLDLVRTARQAGMVSDVDVLSTESQLANDRTLLPPLRQQLSVARHALAILVGRAPGDWTPPEFDLTQFALPSELPLSLPSELVHERPDIMAAEAQLHAASAAIGIATANLYPQLTLTGGVYHQALDVGHFFTPASTAWSVAGELMAPIFHGGELDARRRAAIDAYQASLATYEQTVLESFGQVADVLQSLAHDAEQVAAQRHALESAEASLRLNRAIYSAGKIGILQVLDAERLFEQAHLGHVRAEAQRYQDTTQLFVALGGASLNANTRTGNAQ